jgi:hypothetical protein
MKPMPECVRAALGRLIQIAQSDTGTLGYKKQFVELVRAWRPVLFTS